MNTALWIIQVLLALAFFASGILKVTQPLDKLAQQMGWVHDFPPSFVRLIGGLEVLGAFGLILPALTNILPVLTPTAALGLVIIMIGAVVVHIRRNEFARMAPSVVLLVLSAIVVYGRFVAAPF